MKVIIDTNVLLRSIPAKNKERIIYNAFDSQKFIWVISNEIIMEYAEILSLFYSEKTMNSVLSILLQASNVQFFEPSYKWHLCDDADDNKFVDCAIGANADYLLSDDKHILRINKVQNLFPPVNTINFKQFRKILKMH